MPTEALAPAEAATPAPAVDTLVSTADISDLALETGVLTLTIPAPTTTSGILTSDTTVPGSRAESSNIAREIPNLTSEISTEAQTASAPGTAAPVSDTPPPVRKRVDLENFFDNISIDLKFQAAVVIDAVFIAAMFVREFSYPNNDLINELMAIFSRGSVQYHLLSAREDIFSIFEDQIPLYMIENVWKKV
ncbi:hypothetical protein R1flu_015276 [Riccia fluitans]|uniref:Uncharacterized protein n=1 Tax=Riccia fluitans TaxID=41844 RepID=A0ABD1YIU3_9MARC